jgi:hypothetical protein
MHDAGDRKAFFTLLFGFQTGQLHFLLAARQGLDFGMEHQRGQFVICFLIGNGPGKVEKWRV